jgi:hypothetical protein
MHSIRQRSISIVVLCVSIRARGHLVSLFQTAHMLSVGIRYSTVEQVVEQAIRAQTIATRRQCVRSSRGHECGSVCTIMSMVGHAQVGRVEHMHSTTHCSCQSFNYGVISTRTICELISVATHDPPLSNWLDDAPGWDHYCCFTSS